jgi:Tfp pilus assembly protein PilF
MSNPLSKFGWDLAAGFLLTMSLTMTTDFIHRLLASDPDVLGVFSIATQALLAVAATSTFTKLGLSLLTRFRERVANRRFRKNAPEGAVNTPQSSGSSLVRARWRFGMALAVFVLIAPIWMFVPTVLAAVYNNKGIDLETRGLSEEAMRDYRRAVALQPEQHQTYFELGMLFEKDYQYDQAAEQYRKAILVSHDDARSYSNLSRVLILDGKAALALRVADDALSIPMPNEQTRATLLRNTAWAEYDLGLYPQAIHDAQQSGQIPYTAAAANCLLAKIYTKTNDKEKASGAWRVFRQNHTASQADVEPDCKRLAEEADEGN